MPLQAQLASLSTQRCVVLVVNVDVKSAPHQYPYLPSQTSIPPLIWPPRILELYSKIPCYINTTTLVFSTNTLAWVAQSVERVTLTISPWLLFLHRLGVYGIFKIISRSRVRAPPRAQYPSLSQESAPFLKVLAMGGLVVEMGLWNSGGVKVLSLDKWEFRVGREEHRNITQWNSSIKRLYVTHFLLLSSATSTNVFLYFTSLILRVIVIGTAQSAWPDSGTQPGTQIFEAGMKLQWKEPWWDLVRWE